jgi:hypothetical protein
MYRVLRNYPDLNLVLVDECAPPYWELEYNRELQKEWPADRLDEWFDENGDIRHGDSINLNLPQLIAECKRLGCKDISTIELNIHDAAYPGSGDADMGMTISYTEPLADSEVAKNDRKYAAELTQFKHDKETYKARLGAYQEKNKAYKLLKKKEALKKELAELENE